MRTNELVEMPNIIVQLNKSLDVNGNYLISFNDGKQIKVTNEVCKRFIQRYSALKPLEREKMQKIALQSPEHFNDVLEHFNGQLAEKSIYG